LGLVLLAGLLLQQFAGLRWPALGLLQANDLYKQLTGFVLIAFVLHQWYFPLLRLQSDNAGAARTVGLHKLVGAIAPALFLVHAQHTGHAYQVALSLLLLAVVVTGLVNPETTGIHRPWFRTAWTVAHVAASTALPLLVAYHVWATYAFE
jgi:hypothetical protein